MRLAPLLLMVLLWLGGCSSSEFPEDQRIEGPFELTTEWRTFRFPKPLEINRTGLQGFHLAVEAERYSITGLDDPIENVPFLRREDGVLIKPEVILIADTGDELPVTAHSNVGLFTGHLTIGYGLHIDNWTPPPDYPASMKYFVAARIRSNEPVTVEFMQWWFDSHPDYHRCGRQRCKWWQ
jgi:hypothetical protein